MLYLAGELFNLVGRGPGAITLSPAADPLFPTSKLYDRKTGRIFRFASIGTDGHVTVDINQAPNPGFEISTLASWLEENGGSGATSEGAGAEVHSGSKSLKCVAGSGFASRYIRARAYPGELWGASHWARTVTSGQGVSRILNEDTGHYYVGGAWQPAAGDASLQVATSYGSSPFTTLFQVEDWDTCKQKPWVTLRFTLRASAGTACFDDVVFAPLVNFCSIHGHNLGPIAPELRSDDAAFAGAGTKQADMIVRRPAFYSYLQAPVFAPQWRVRFVGTPLEPIYLGQLVLGYARTSPVAPAWGYSNDFEFPQERQDSPGGETFVYGISDEAPVMLNMDFAPDGVTELVGVRDEIYKACKGGGWPLIVVPIEDEPAVHYGRVAPGLSVGRSFVASSETQLTLQEGPFPVVGLF